MCFVVRRFGWGAGWQRVMDDRQRDGVYDLDPFSADHAQWAGPGERGVSGDGLRSSGGLERTGSAMKVKASVRRICGACQIVRRKGKVRVICKSDPKHKQVQG